MKDFRSHLLAVAFLPLLGGSAVALDIPKDVMRASELEAAKKAAAEEGEGITFVWTKPSLKPT